MITRVVTVSEAEAALRYFNGFHDGFIRRLTLHSHDRFEARGVHQVSGRLDLELLFGHYNYRDGEPPADQLVEARFYQVRDLVTDISHRHGEWSIDRVLIEASEPGLETRVVLHRLAEGRWSTHEAIRFAFRQAEFTESPG